MNRREMLSGLLAAALAPRLSWGQPVDDGVFWVHVQAGGGFDQALFCDPKPDVRRHRLDRDLYLYNVPVRDAAGRPGQGTGIVRNPSAGEVRSTSGGGIPYLGFADFHGDPADPTHPYRPFFSTLADRLTVFNGVDTATNNHVVGERYSASGSLNEGYPCLAAQLAAGLGAGRPLSFLNLGGYDETAALLAATPLSDALLPNLLAAVNPNDISGNNEGDDVFLAPEVLTRVRAAQDVRRADLRAAWRLPGQRRALEAVDAALNGREALARLRFRSNDLSTRNLVRVAFEAYRQGLATSLNLQSGGFDSHEDNEQQQVEALYRLFDHLTFLVAESESPEGGQAPIPVVIVVTSDFGRTAHHAGAGTDHWPISSVLVLQNRLALRRGFALPTNAVIGGTTDGDEHTALRARRIDPVTFRFDDRGIVLTPGHILRVLRRMARVADHPRLARFPLTVDRELALG